MSVAEVLRKALRHCLGMQGRWCLQLVQVAGLAALAICCIVRSTCGLLKTGLGHPWQGPNLPSRSEVVCELERPANVTLKHRAESFPAAESPLSCAEHATSAPADLRNVATPVLA